MIVDTSAIVAILAGEPERGVFTMLMASAESTRLSAGSLIEVAAVITRRRIGTHSDLAALLDAAEIKIEPVSEEQGRIGYEGYCEFGIGSGHRARLNFGDCFAYALAKASGEPLLFKGDDFIHTDVEPAWIAEA